MTIHEGFIERETGKTSNNNTDTSLVAAYSIPSPREDFFEKNIVISEDVLGSLSFDKYIDESIAGIRNTRGTYQSIDSSTTTILCNQQELPAKKNFFSIQRGGLQNTGQLLYFMQYFFAKGGKIIILSSSTDDLNDKNALESYMDSIQCVQNIFD